MLKALVLPGLDGTGELLSDFTAALGVHLPVHTIAYPRDQTLDYAQLREFVRARLPQDDFVLIAESFSGPVALALAAEALPGLRAVVFCASFARVDMPVKPLLAAVASLVPLRWLPSRVMSWWLWGRWTTSERTRLLANVLSKVGPDVLRLRAREALATGAPAAPLPSVPVLHLRARRDRLLGCSVDTTLHALTPHAQVRAFDAPHFLLQVRPSEAAAAIAAFIRSVQPE